MGPHVPTSLEADLRRHLSNERADLAAQLGKHARLLNEAMTSGQLQNISYLRGRILRLENEVREINRLIAALDKRFPEEEARCRA